jgi:hypothetical protein
VLQLTSHYNLFFVPLDPYSMWPCGDIIISFKSIPENWPKSHWAWHNSTSFKAKGTTSGKVVYRVCKGCIICTNLACSTRIRPQVKANGMGIAKQVEKSAQGQVAARSSYGNDAKQNAIGLHWRHLITMAIKPL